MRRRENGRAATEVRARNVDGGCKYQREETSLKRERSCLSIWKAKSQGSDGPLGLGEKGSKKLIARREGGRLNGEKVGVWGTISVEGSAEKGEK